MDVSAGTATYDLQGVKLIGAPGEGNEMIKVYNSSAIFTKENIRWYTPDGYGEPEGWYDSEDEKVVGKTVPMGTGLYLYCPAKNVKIQYAGQVYAGPLTNDLPNVGYNMVGNSTPGIIDLQSIKLIGAPGEGNEMIKVYNASAIFTKENIRWYTPDGYGEPEGWYNSDDEKVEMSLRPGEGVYLYCPAKNVKIVIPGAINN